MTLKFTIEKVKEIFESENYKLISTEYKNSATALSIICPVGHPWSVTLNNFNSQEQRCPTCFGRTIYNTQIVENLLKKDGYILITKPYKKMAQKLELLCPKGHTYMTSLTNYVSHGSRCFTCSGIKRYTIQEIGLLLAKENYSIVTKEYKNARQKIESICPVGHNCTFTMNDFISRKVRCGQCAKNRPYPENFVKDFIEKEGYILLDENYCATKKLSLLCPQKHVYNTTTFYNFKKGRRCPQCSKVGQSKMEKDGLNWIKGYFPSATKYRDHYDDSNGKKYLELDAYIPEIKLGIEWDGLIWHSEKFKKDKNFHLNKMKLANSLGIRVINIFEDEWKNRLPQIKNYLLSVMNKNKISIGARKTDLNIVDRKIASDFLDKNHIQGAASIGVAFGLYYKKELVGIMTGDKHHRQGQETSFVLNRLAFKTNVSVYGGSSKLLKALIEYTKSKGYKRLVSWSDNRWSEGKVYEKMGFVLEEDMGPDYSYTNNHAIRSSKQSCTKKSLIKKGAKGTMENTEKELALTLGLHRIWDCGKKRWVMDLSSK